ncbi:MAG: DTW domain-containing protein [Burkholderiaceae bacterium]|nr:MAG: DTW domain-containing protein [Burkholderiaceae bacterium]
MKPMAALLPSAPPQGADGHAVARLRSARLARSAKPFLARGGPRGTRCPGCRLPPSHCLCGLCPTAPSPAGFCLLMADTEPLKPSNTGWLVADLVADTFAFGWARTEVDPALLALLAAPQWQPCLVFPSTAVAPARVCHSPPAPRQSDARPLFILLDATWPEAGKMLRKSPYLQALPVLSLQPEQDSRYQLRRARQSGQLCTAEVAARCLALAGDAAAAARLDAYLDVFIHHYQQAKHQLPPQLQGPAHQRLRTLLAAAG